MLAAQRQMYSEAKSTSNYQFAVCVVLPILFPFLKAATPSNSMYLGLITLLPLIILIVNHYYFEKIIKDKKEKAARFQDLFDTNVLQIAWNSDLCGSKEIAARNLRYTAQKYKKNNETLENLINWYPNEYSTVDLSAGRVMCQKVNASWDGQIRTAFQNFLLLIFAGCIVLIIAVSIALNRTFIETLFSIIAPLFPIAFYTFKRYSENKDSIARLEKLTDKAERLWGQVLNSTREPNDLAIKSRQLQNEIYKHRSSALLIWDWFYLKNRPKQECNMSDTAKLIVEEYHSQGGIIV
ncbi:S-4TM family putative pore-forming effector [Paenibacillus alginolyticus]|uniref:S-4TM family putative pore-forming effector n=1 Tax=Paenibacillus alginolyticus TaxID=59839 RepID=A0ABT4G7X6_9BACL|nr:S-4TM family putative pore-forming effector [Paenibacillus alginolyticus]